MIPTTFTFLTIDQWLKANPGLKLEKGECEECDGSGEHECECGDEHDCGYCDGTGRAEGESFPDLYKEQLERDVARLEKYLKNIGGEGIDHALTSLEETQKKLIKDSRSWRGKKV